MKNQKWLAIGLAMLLLSTAVFAGGQQEAQDGVVEIEYMLWDSNQQPAYEAAAQVFMERNPNIRINITQMGWGDYWDDIPRRMISGDGPDVFTNHLAFAEDFIERNQIVDIQPLVARDNVPTDIYFDGLADLWSRGNARYGLPKDWDTITIVINEDLFQAAGVDLEETNNWTWNPEDGGSFGRILRQVAAAGDHYAHAGDFVGAFGQEQWSHFAYSTGWTFQDQLFGRFQYEDPRLSQTISWIRGLMDDGVIAPMEDVSSLGQPTMFTSGAAASVGAGSWMIGFYVENSDFNIRFAPLPTGPQGQRSMINGLADSIWVGSPHQEEAWQWVKFLGTEEAQTIIASYGVVFTAVRGTEQHAINRFAERGIDVSAYTDLVQDPSQTFLFPLSRRGSEVDETFQNAFESIYLEGVDVRQTLNQANQRVNSLLGF